MGWEKRGNQKYYYYKIREGGRVRSKYMGTGFYAQLCDRLAENRRLEQAALRSEREADAEIDRQLNEAGDAIYALTDAELHAAGYHNHKGQWRKQHESNAVTATC
jgi:hypothetical protein